MKFAQIFLDNKKETRVVDTNIYNLDGLNEDLIDIVWEIRMIIKN